MKELTIQKKYGLYCEVNDIKFTYSKHQYDTPQCGLGWWPLVINMFKELRANDWNGELASIKQKWGLLEVYFTIPYSILPSHQNEIVKKYTDLARHTCEETGATTDLGWWTDGWITLVSKVVADKKAMQSGTKLEDCWQKEHPFKLWEINRATKKQPEEDELP